MTYEDIEKRLKTLTKTELEKEIEKAFSVVSCLNYKYALARQIIKTQFFIIDKCKQLTEKL